MHFTLHSHSSRQDQAHRQLAVPTKPVVVTADSGLTYSPGIAQEAASVLRASHFTSSRRHADSMAPTRKTSRRSSKSHASKNNKDSVTQGSASSSTGVGGGSFAHHSRTPMFARNALGRVKSMIWKGGASSPASDSLYSSEVPSSSSSASSPSSSVRSSTSPERSDTAMPGSYLHNHQLPDTIPMDVDEDTVSLHYFPDSTPLHAMMDVDVPTGGAAARAAAASANRQKVHRKDSNLAFPPPAQEYGRENRESGIMMAIDQDDMIETRPRRESQVQAQNPLSVLPAELSAQIFSQLPAESLYRASQVSKEWEELTRDTHIWREAFKGAWQAPPRSNPLPLAVGGKGVGKAPKYGQDWAQMYRARKQIEENWRKGDAMAIYLNGHTDSVYCVQFDEHYIYTGSRDRTIRVWDINTYACLKVIGIPEALSNDRLHRAHPNPNNALPQHPPTIMYNPNPAGEPNPAIYHTPRAYHDASILCLQLDDKIAVTGSSDNSLIVWDLATWQPIRRLLSHSAGVLDVAFDEEKIVSCSKDSTLCIWDRFTGQLLQKIDGHRGPVNAVQLRGQLVISASGEGCARLWHLGFKRQFNPATNEWESSADAKCIKEFWSKDRGLACIEFSDDGRHVLAGGNDQLIFKFDANTGTLVKAMQGHDNLVRSLYLDEANGRIISGSYDSSIRVWDLETGEQQMCFPSWTNSWMLSAKGDYRRIVCTSQDSRALILDFGFGVSGAELLVG